MQTILVTGFEPFGGEDINPSWEVAKRLDGQEINRRIVTAQGLPTTFAEAGEVLIETIERIRPDFVVCLGEAGGRVKITPERVAINVVDARIPDNRGNQPVDQAIDPDGPAAYFSGLPIRHIVDTLCHAGVPAAISDSAGTYVCNYVFYRLMRYIDLNKSAIRGGFIHVPYLAEQTVAKSAAGWPIEFIEQGIHKAIATLS